MTDKNKKQSILRKLKIKLLQKYGDHVSDQINYEILRLLNLKKFDYNVNYFRIIKNKQDLQVTE